VLLALAAAAPAPAGQTPASAQPDPTDRGTFELYAAGKSIGTERFEIRSHAEQVEAQSEIHLQVEQAGKVVEARTTSNLVLDPQLRPLAYTWTQRGTQSSHLEIDFRSSPVRTHYKTVSGQKDEREFKLPKDVVVLDDNVLHHYQLLLDRYDPAAGGKQTFQAFIPQEALPGVVTVEQAGMGPAPRGESAQNLRHFVLTTELARVDLWVDSNTHLQAVAVPEAQFQAVRKK